ncbi:MAG: nicotinate-nucleotide adenylyltransferase [Gammaproteobacteria bacterium]|nr:nicotinate-nucleotide adenylyltransferase [Gammaproteobacteria bacterium]MDH5660603.1 nicotinate-nucleotide adenylyltransferase [Gammaproteobacteria bacterium]
MIGILGGTFDPIHYGHLRTALDVQQALSLDEVRFIPCGEPPHRNKPLAAPLQRLSMVRAAIAGQEKFTVDDREIRRNGPSYMVDTLASLKQDFKDESLCLIIGTDAFNSLDQWYQWQRIFDLSNIVVMRRPAGEGQPGLNKRVYKQVKHRVVDKDELTKKQNGGICFVSVTQLDISATVIRQLWHQGNDIQFFLPDSVLRLIQQQNIY